MLLVIIVVCLGVLPCWAQSAKDSVWIQTKNGCKVYNPHPTKNETITWSGNCSGGHASGTGTLQWFTNQKLNQQYDGEMKRGVPQGKGRYWFEDGTVHEGTYVNGDLHGFGTISERHKNNAVSYLYNGEMKDDYPSGNGREIEFSERGDTLMTYVGQFLKGKKHGEGTKKRFVDNFVSVSIGKFKDGRLEGQVEIYEYNKSNLFDHYKGEFSNYVRNGYGECVRGNNRYSGEWRQDQREGKGKSYLDSMLVYDGEWHADKFHGSGKRRYFDGSTYFGEFKENLRHGIGTHRYKDNSLYIGEFAGDLYSGYGYVMKDGKVVACGSWANGALVTELDLKRTKNALMNRHKTKLSQFGISL